MSSSRLFSGRNLATTRTLPGSPPPALAGLAKGLEVGSFFCGSAPVEALRAARSAADSLDA